MTAKPNGRERVIAVFGDACPVCTHSITSEHGQQDGICLVCDTDCANREWPPQQRKRFTDYWSLHAQPDPEPKTICWLAYYSDYSGMSVFFNEIDALRCAVGSHMEVIELKEGDVMEQINASHKQ